EGSGKYLISSNDIVLELDAAEPAIPVYLLLGIEHLLLGIDHVLFVLVLLTIVSGWKNLLKVVTSFTVAHSMTLGLSALGIVTVSQAPVEAMIALSIVLLAWESLKGKTGLVNRTPWLVAFAFGLLHGLGFASALAEIGLPQFGALVALLLFNIGIELGQLIVIGIALGGAFLYRRLPWNLDYQVAATGLYLIGGVATYWAIDRLWLILA
ncbi:MAG: HupE/UreJ family protein, partial [bacterium]